MWAVEAFAEDEEEVEKLLMATMKPNSLVVGGKNFTEAVKNCLKGKAGARLRDTCSGQTGGSRGLCLIHCVLIG